MQPSTAVSMDPHRKQGPQLVATALEVPGPVLTITLFSCFCWWPLQPAHFSRLLYTVNHKPGSYVQELARAGNRSEAQAVGDRRGRGRSALDTYGKRGQ